MEQKAVEQNHVSPTNQSPPFPAYRISQVLQIIIADLCLQQYSNMHLSMDQLQSIPTQQISIVEIVNLQLLQKLYFIRQELQILNQVTPSVEDKIRELMERVHYSMRDTSKIEQYFQKE